jgi:hypothetical protein
MRLVGLLSIALVVSGGAVAYREISPFVAPGTGDAALFQSILDGQLQPGLSELSRRIVLVDCLQVTRSFFTRVQSTARRDEMLKGCDELSAGIAESAPSYSLAWFVAAAMAAERGNDRDLSERLVRSQRTGPHEQWVAEQRVQLAEDHLRRLDDAALAGHQADLAMLVRSERGVNSIARRYLEVSAFRERITSIVETLPNEDRRRFLTQIKRLASETGS